MNVSDNPPSQTGAVQPVLGLPTLRATLKNMTVEHGSLIEAIEDLYPNHAGVCPMWRRK